MPLYLTENDVASLISMPEAIEALRASFAAQARGDAINQPRRRLRLPAGTYHTMVAADLDLQLFGQKAYCSFAPKTRFLFLLHDARSGDLLAIIEADRMGQIRTGAASGVATAYLAPARQGLRVGIYGAGWQAQSQLEAVCSVRSVASVLVYSRTAEKREAFGREMTARLGLPVLPCESPETAAAGADIVITATTAREAVLRGEWLAPGAHVNAVGGNLLMKREIDDAVVSRSGLIVVDSIEQAQREAGDLLPASERGLFRWEQVRELYEIVAGSHPGRTAEDQITLFKSIGIALEDVAVAARIYRNAIARNVGSTVPMWAQ